MIVGDGSGELRVCAVEGSTVLDIVCQTVVVVSAADNISASAHSAVSTDGEAGGIIIIVTAVNLYVGSTAA